MTVPLGSRMATADMLDALADDLVETSKDLHVELVRTGEIMSSGDPDEPDLCREARERAVELRLREAFP